MLDMNRAALAAAVAAHRPGTPVLFMSGYPDETIAPHGVLAPGTPFLFALANDALCAFLGIARAELIGSTGIEFFPLTRWITSWRWTAGCVGG
jgi:hypothetical protein